MIRGNAQEVFASHTANRRTALNRLNKKSN
jgi:hypothetical protein